MSQSCFRPFVTATMVDQVHCTGNLGDAQVRSNVSVEKTKNVAQKAKT